MFRYTYYTYMYNMYLYSYFIIHIIHICIICIKCIYIPIYIKSMCLRILSEYGTDSGDKEYVRQKPINILPLYIHE